MCIIKKKWHSKMIPESSGGPSFGEIVTASDCPIFSGYYLLAEYPVDNFGNPAAFNKKNFVHLSTIDETELLEQREDCLVKL